MHRLIRTAFAIAVLSASMGPALADGQPYRAPAHNYYQNNWISGAR
jgi:hypothetical protein